MNRQTLMIGAILSVAVVVVFGVAVYLNRGGPDDAAITGPGRAAEARGIIAEIESRRAGETPANRPAPALIERAPDETAERIEQDEVARNPAAAPAAASGAGSELDAAYDRAMELQAAGQLDDAQVLLFFGARQGHARSAFAYAEINDPIHHSPETSLLAEPDAFQAFRWYSAALQGGVEAAADRLEVLHDWARSEAENGNSEAERLLLQWE